jgi:VanZ family protein
LARKTLVYISISLTLFVALVSLMPINQQAPTSVRFLDKLVHMFMYFLLTFSWLKTLNKKRDNINHIYKILLLIILYGIIIEVLQEILTINRHGDLKDVIANILGTVLAGVVYKQISKKN